MCIVYFTGEHHIHSCPSISDAQEGSFCERRIEGEAIENKGKSHGIKIELKPDETIKDCRQKCEDISNREHANGCCEYEFPKWCRWFQVSFLGMDSRMKYKEYWYLRTPDLKGFQKNNLIRAVLCTGGMNIKMICTQVKNFNYQYLNYI